MSRILVVEDEPAVALLVEMNLRHAGHVVVVAADASAAQAAVDAELPDLVLLDWMLPDASGIVLARRWRAAARTQSLPIIMLTARAEEADKVSGLDAGADDYLVKPFSANELLARIRALLRRKLPEALDSVLEAGGLRLDPATHRVSFQDPAAPAGSDTAGHALRLGPTEFRLLHFLMAHPERVHSRSQLLDKVWGDHVFIEERTVDVHVKRLREALAPAGCATLVETVRGAGYRLVMQPAPASADAGRAQPAPAPAPAAPGPVPAPAVAPTADRSVDPPADPLA